MRKSALLLWIISSAIVIVIDIAHDVKVSKLHDTINFFYTPLFLISTYLFFSISSIKNKLTLKAFFDAGDFMAKYFLSIFALFSAYLLLASDFVVKLGYSKVFGTLWYALLSLFILFVALMPATYLFLRNEKSTIPKAYFILIVLIFGWAFSALTAIINVSQLGIPFYWDSSTFMIISFIEEFVLVGYTLYFFKLKLKPELS